MDETLGAADGDLADRGLAGAWHLAEERAAQPGGEVVERGAGARARPARRLDWGEEQLRRHIPGYEPLAFAPPYGAYGQLATNDPAIPSALRDELRRRYGLVFVQEHPRAAREGDTLVPRLQLTRAITGGDLHAWLATA